MKRLKETDPRTSASAEFLTHGELLFLIGLTFEIIAAVASLTTFQYRGNTDLRMFILKSMRYTGYFVMLVKLFQDYFELRGLHHYLHPKRLLPRIFSMEMMPVLIVLVICGADAFFGSNYLFLLSLFIVGMKGVRFDRVAQWMAIVLCIAVVVTVLGSQLGYLENWDYNLSGVRPRVALGYYYPSHAATALLYAILALCYVLKDRLSWWLVLLLEAVNVYEYLQTDCRTGFAITAASIILFYVLKFIPERFLRMKGLRIVCLIFPLCAAFCLIGCLQYEGSGFWQMINGILNRRLEYGSAGIENYGIGLMGQSISWVGWGGVGFTVTDATVDELRSSYNYVDCSYIKLLLEYGLIPWLMLLVGFTLATYRAMEKRNWWLAAALCVTAVYSIVEPRLIEIGYSPFVLVLAVLVMPDGQFLQSKVRPDEPKASSRGKHSASNGEIQGKRLR